MLEKDTRPYRFERVGEIFEYIPDPFLIRTFDEVFRSGKFKWAGVSKGDLSEVFEAMRFVVMRDGQLESFLFSLRKDNRIIIYTENELKGDEASLSPEFRSMLDEKLQREGLQTAAAMVVSKSKSGEMGTSIAYPELLHEFCENAPDTNVDYSSTVLAWAMLKATPLGHGRCLFPITDVRWAPGADIKRGLITSKRIVQGWDGKYQHAPLPRIESLRNSLLGHLIFKS